MSKTDSPPNPVRPVEEVINTEVYVDGPKTTEDLHRGVAWRKSGGVQPHLGDAN